jgi:very-short-patch-repair endonuclease
VVLGDAILGRGQSSLDALARIAAGARHRRGVRLLRLALPLLEPRTDSPMETRLRLLLVRAGLPRPEANRDVVVDGEWIARPDLSYPGVRIAIEYDGDHHRSRRQWRSDRARRQLLEDAGWVVLEFTADDVLRRPEATVERVRRALCARAR